MRHIISILVENESGALSRIAGLFSARGYNIESLSVAPTEDESLSRLTLVTRGSDEVIEQITKQLNKLVDVYRLQDLSGGPHIEREMLLLKVRAEGALHDDVRRLAETFHARIVDATDGTCVVELTGTGDEISAFIDAAQPLGIVEVVRTGVSGIGRGERSLKVENESSLSAG